MSQIGWILRELCPFEKNAACRVTAQKSTFFSSKRNWGQFCFWADDSYVEKSEKNIGENIFTLSIAVFPEFAIKVSKGGNCVNREI